MRLLNLLKNLFLSKKAKSVLIKEISRLCRNALIKFLNHCFCLSLLKVLFKKARSKIFFRSALPAKILYSFFKINAGFLAQVLVIQVQLIRKEL